MERHGRELTAHPAFALDLILWIHRLRVPLEGPFAWK